MTPMTVLLIGFVAWLIVSVLLGMLIGSALHRLNDNPYRGEHQ